MIALLKNNKSLALALENDRAEKEELLAESKANADIIMFSRLKLAGLSENLKKAASVVDETLSLLEMHSSISITKRIPKSIICREKFKGQLKDVSMAAVAEEIESPQSKQAQENVVNKAEGLSAISENSEGLSAISENSEAASFPVNRHSCHNSYKNMSDKRCQSLLKNVIKESITTTSKQNGFSNELISSPLKEICVDTGFNKKISENCLSSSTQMKRNKASVNERESAKKVNSPLSRNISKTKSSHLKSCPLNKKSLETPVTLCRNSKQIKIAYDPESVLKGINVLKDGSADINFAKSISCKNNQMYENQRNQKPLDLTKITNNRVELAEICLNSFESTHRISDVSNVVKVVGDCNVNVVSDSNAKLVSFDHAKENVEICELQDKSISTQFKIFEDDKLEFSNPQRPKVRKTALKNLSPEINIENFKQGLLKRQSSSQMDDLTIVAVIEKDSYPSIAKKNKLNHNSMNQTNSIITKKAEYSENVQPISDNDSRFKSPHSEKTVHQDEEMVRNLAKNTFLVTAEIHKLPKSIVSKKIVSNQSTDCVQCMQPVVLVNDIFKASKSICRSISYSSNNEQKENPLEKQLLEHCSSLKLIPHESSEKRNKNSANVNTSLECSVEQDRSAGHTKAVTFFEEPPLFVEGEFKEELLNEEKKKLRKRSSICYTEPLLNMKMRR